MLRYFALLILFSLLNTKTTAQVLYYDTTEHIDTGYILFYKEYKIFFRCKIFHNPINFDDLENKSGHLLRSMEPYVYWDCNKLAEEVNVTKTIKNEYGVKTVITTYKLIPVQIKYHTVGAIIAPDECHEFEYKSKKYKICYEDKWDMLVDSMKPLNK